MTATMEVLKATDAKFYVGKRVAIQTTDGNAKEAYIEAQGGLEGCILRQDDMRKTHKRTGSIVYMEHGEWKLVPAELIGAEYTRLMAAEMARERSRGGH
jgi:hypothetical protein